MSWISLRFMGLWRMASIDYVGKAMGKAKKTSMCGVMDVRRTVKEGDMKWRKGERAGGHILHTRKFLKSSRESPRSNTFLREPEECKEERNSSYPPLFSWGHSSRS